MNQEIDSSYRPESFSGVSKKESYVFPLAKIKSDLRSGFQMSHEDKFGGERTIIAATVFEDDIFELELHTRNLQPYITYPNGFEVYEGIIRRREVVRGPGSYTLESWSIKTSTHERLHIHENYRIQEKKGGHLDQAEFFRRYSQSEVDHELTEVIFAYSMESIRKDGRKMQMDWVSDLDPVKILPFP